MELRNNFYGREGGAKTSGRNLFMLVFTKKWCYLRLIKTSLLLKKIRDTNKGVKVNRERIENVISSLLKGILTKKE